LGVSLHYADTFSQCGHFLCASFHNRAEVQGALQGASPRSLTRSRERSFRGAMVLAAPSPRLALHGDFLACRKPSDAKYANSTKAVQLTHIGID
jgi:hypothetical protein